MMRWKLKNKNAGIRNSKKLKSTSLLPFFLDSSSSLKNSLIFSEESVRKSFLGDVYLEKTKNSELFEICSTSLVYEYTTVSTDLLLSIFLW